MLLKKGSELRQTRLARGQPHHCLLEYFIVCYQYHSRLRQHRCCTE